MKQLDIFKSKRQRGVKAPPPLEFPIHCMVADSLRLQCDWIWFHCPSGELRTKQTAAKLQRMGVKPGVPDFLLVKPGSGRLYGLELKRLGKKPTDEQSAFGRDLIAAGGWWAWTDSYVGAIVLLKRWGALPEGFDPQ
jgi:hypothetical protein